MLVDAFWRQNKADVVAAPEIAAATPTPLDLDGLTYMRWNMVAESFRKFRRRDMSTSADPDGTIPTLPVWAFHRTPKEGQFRQSRINAIKLQHLISVLQEAYDG